MVIELNKDYRALDAVIEDAIGLMAADPAKMRRREVLFYLLTSLSARPKLRNSALPAKPATTRTTAISNARRVARTRAE